MHQLPLPEKANAPGKKTIYINPNFKAHINPLFVNPPIPRMIHMNPQFLENQLKHMHAHNGAQLVDYSKQPSAALAQTPTPTQIAAVHINPTRKLVRNNTTKRDPTTIKLATVKPMSSSSSSTRKYKIDRRPTVAASSLPTQLKLIRNGNMSKTTLPSTATSSGCSVNKQKVNERRLRLVNINGMLYRSTYNKLQRKDEKASTIKTKLQCQKTAIPCSKRPLGKSIFLNGNKFLMDATGFKLKRLPSQTAVNAVPSIRQRIDIGGITYVAAHTNDVFVRTRNHLTMAHLNNAKHRSLQLLTRHLVKSNIPCAIFQRLGKCKGYERGKCNKVHDKKQVVICQKFLQGECLQGECLLSHNVSLSKMPVCKFYLQGVCMRADCPYLHKKLSQTVEICKDFLQGFCKLAKQCDKRHEFICTKANASGKCTSNNCLYCQSSSKRVKMKTANLHTVQKVNINTATPLPDPLTDKDDEITAPTVRYFSGQTDKCNAEDTSLLDNNDEKDDSASSPSTTAAWTTRPKLGTLPAFIPLT